MVFSMDRVGKKGIQNFFATMEVKSVGTFPLILLKLATPPLPPQTKLNLEQNGWNWVLFFAKTLLGEAGGGGRRDEPKAEHENWP